MIVANVAIFQPEPIFAMSAVPPRGKPQVWVSADDYSPESIANCEQGIVFITFNTNDRGRIENCRVTRSSGFPRLDEATCRLVLRRGRYSPTLDQKGDPVASGPKMLRYVWKLPEKVSDPVMPVKPDQ